MWLKRINWFCLGLLLFASACELESLDDPVVVTDVEDEFYVDMWEELNANQRNLFFNIRTIENETCLNTTIATVFSKLGNELTLELNGIETPEDCLEGEAPALGSENAGQLSAGPYKIAINLQNTIFNSGQLDINQSRYLLNLETENGIKILRSVLLRVPENLLWGYIAYKQESQTSIAESFMTDLRTLTREISLPIGYYGYFTINQNAPQIQVSDSPNSEYLIPFFYSYDAEMEESIQNIVTEFRANNPDPEIALFNYKGESF